MAADGRRHGSNVGVVDGQPAENDSSSVAGKIAVL